MLETGEAYAPPFAPRFRVEPAAGGGQRIVIPAQRSLLVMAFLLVWLGAWTIGGLTAMRQLNAHFQPFLAFWLCGWALGEAMVASILLWMAAGRETLTTDGDDLEISNSIFGFSRRRRYRGADIRGLSSSTYVRYRNGRLAMDMPMYRAPGSGGVKFSYGARTVYAGVGLDETEGQMIVDVLKRRLPKSAA